MESTLIVVGNPADPRIKHILSDPVLDNVPYETCPDAYSAAVCLAGKPPGIILGSLRVFRSRKGQLLTLAANAGWRCGILTENTGPGQPWNLLASLHDRVHLIPAHQETWRDLIQQLMAGSEYQPSVRPDDLASPEEIEALLEGFGR